MDTSWITSTQTSIRMHPASSWAPISPCQQNSKPTRLQLRQLPELSCTFLQQCDSSCSVDDDNHRQTQIHVKYCSWFGPLAHKASGDSSKRCNSSYLYLSISIYTVAVATCSSRCSSIGLRGPFQEKLKSTTSEVETWRSWNGLRLVKEPENSRIPPAFSHQVETRNEKTLKPRNPRNH